MESNFKRLADILKESNYVVFFTGAGASTETSAFAH